MHQLLLQALSSIALEGAIPTPPLAPGEPVSGLILLVVPAMIILHPRRNSPQDDGSDIVQKRRVLGTIKMGKVKITSPKQIRYLEWKKLPYTRITKKGKKVRRNVR